MLCIDHVQLAAPPDCESAARAFFGGLLGLTEREKQGETATSGGVWFSAGAVELHIGVTDAFIPARKAHVALRAETQEALSALAGALSAAGHPVDWDTRLPGVRRFFTADPWGNRLELMCSA
jgi:catechol 2,3-dioxygenase-like lactoylglutathione lyase family enzyme